MDANSSTSENLGARDHNRMSIKLFIYLFIYSEYKASNSKSTYSTPHIYFVMEPDTHPRTRLVKK